MIDFLKKTLPKLSGQIAKTVAKTALPIMAVIKGYFKIVLFLIVLYIVAWLAEWYTTGKPELQNMLELIKILTNPYFVAFVTFVAGYLVDKNKNGIPDPLEKEGANNDDKKNNA